MRQKILVLCAVGVTIIIGIIIVFVEIYSSTKDKKVENRYKNDSEVVNYNSYEAVQNVIYPATYEFEDYDAETQIVMKNSVNSKLYKGIDEFAYKTATQIINENAGNVNYSPLSLYYALAIAATGAEGETLEELLDILGMSSKEELSTQCGNLYRRMYTDNSIGKLKIANSLWMNKDIVWKDEFVKNSVENFYASTFSADFSKKETAQAMAKWVYDNSNATLSPLIELDPQQILSIFNVVYFYDEWQNNFSKSDTREDTFYLSDETKVKGDFLNKTEQNGFYKGENFTRAALSLKNTGQMIFILPDEGVSARELVSDTEKLKSIFESGTQGYGEVVWKIPKFSFNTKFDVKESMQNLGLKSMFGENANFTGITDQKAFISGISQETHIGVNEEGVEASAFTQIMYVGAAVPEDNAEMILNRPFIYAITSSDGVVLFIGICENPYEN